jgi:monofunctional biosynthetic peptidoglycan transglycosylase
MTAAPPRWRRWFDRCVVAGILLLATTVLAVGALRWISPPTTAFMVRERLSGSGPIAYQWVPAERISTEMALAVVASEDQNFPTHFGFDIAQIRRVLDAPGAPSRGASTITQQVAKNLFLWPGGGYARKGIEAYLAVWIEALWPKERILEMYLNIAEFGPATFGVEAATRRYFDRSAAELTSDQAARLAAVLPSPKRMSAAAPSAYVRERANTIRSQVRNLGGPAFLDGVWR